VGFSDRQASPLGRRQPQPIADERSILVGPQYRLDRQRLASSAEEALKGIGPRRELAELDASDGRVRDACSPGECAL
jgi:hypothetical protein